MLIPYSWLKDFLPLHKSAEEVAEDLAASVIGVKEVKEENTARGEPRHGRGEKVLDLDVTYNRGDLLSVLGVARELAAIYDLELKEKESEFHPPPSLTPLHVKTPQELARYYTLTKISNLSYQSTPKLIRKRLEAAGMRSVNLWADLANYIMLEYGQPFHAFDAEKIAHRDPTVSIEVRRAKRGEVIKTLDGLDHPLAQEDSIIADRRGPIAIAGIMGSEDTEVDEGTKELLLEAAIFDPLSIRRTARRLGLRSESSNRFEHFLSVKNLNISLNKLVHQYLLYGKGQVTGFSAVGEEKGEITPVVLTLEKLSAIAGELIPLPQARTYLEKLGFKVMASEKGLLSWPPYFRGDIKIAEDLAEEVLRLRGYKNLLAHPLQTTLTGGGENRLEEWRDQLTHLTADLGFSEVKTYPFVSTSVLAHLDRDKLLRLQNPISVEAEYLRPNLLFSLLEVAQRNVPKEERGRIFELEKVYPGPKGEKDEILHFGALLWGEDTFLKLKGILEAIAKKTHLQFEFAHLKSGALHPIKALEAKVGKEKLGFLGEVHPHLSKAFGLPEAAAFELDFEKLAERASPWGTFTPLSPYPEVYEEFSFLFPESRELGKLIQQIRNAAAIVWEVELVDRYQNKEGERSVTLSVTFQSDERGLSGEDVRPVRQKIQSLIHKNGGTLRV